MGVSQAVKARQVTIQHPLKDFDMSRSIGYDSNHNRDVGYGVPAICDHPDCEEKINRGLSYVCGSDMFGGEHGCGLYFCQAHRESREFEDDEWAEVCERCAKDRPHFKLKPDAQEWRDHKRTHESWAQWREENPEQASAL